MEAERPGLSRSYGSADQLGIMGFLRWIQKRGSTGSIARWIAQQAHRGQKAGWTLEDTIQGMLYGHSGGV